LDLFFFSIDFLFYNFFFKYENLFVSEVATLFYFKKNLFAYAYIPSSIKKWNSSFFYLFSFFFSHMLSIVSPGFFQFFYVISFLQYLDTLMAFFILSHALMIFTPLYLGAWVLYFYDHYIYIFIKYGLPRFWNYLMDVIFKYNFDFFYFLRGINWFAIIYKKYTWYKRIFPFYYKIYREQSFNFIFDSFLYIPKKFNEHFIMYPLNGFVQSFSFLGAPFLYKILDFSLNYFHIEFFNEFFYNYFLVKDSFFFDSIISAKTYFFSNQFQSFKEDILFDCFSKKFSSADSYLNFLRKKNIVTAYNRSVSKTVKGRDWSIYFSNVKTFFSKNLPEYADIFKYVSFIFKDYDHPEITTFIFGNQSLNIRDLLYLKSPRLQTYKVNNDLFFELFLKDFINSYSYDDFFFESEKDFLNSDFIEKFFYDKIVKNFWSINSLEIFHKFFFKYPEYRFLEFFENFDDSAKFLLLKNFFKINKDTDFVFLWDIIFTLFSPENSEDKPLTEIFSKEMIAFIEQGFKEADRKFFSEMHKNLFIKHIFFFIYDEFRFFYQAIHQKKPLRNNVVFLRDAFDEDFFDSFWPSWQPKNKRLLRLKRFTWYSMEFLNSLSNHKFNEIAITPHIWDSYVDRRYHPKNYSTDFLRQLKLIDKATIRKKKDLLWGWRHFHLNVREFFIYVNPKNIVLNKDLALQKFLDFFSSYNYILHRDAYNNIIIHILRFDSELKDLSPLKNFFRKKMNPSFSIKFYINDFFNFDNNLLNYYQNIFNYDIINDELSSFKKTSFFKWQDWEFDNKALLDSYFKEWWRYNFYNEVSDNNISDLKTLTSKIERNRIFHPVKKPYNTLTIKNIIKSKMLFHKIIKVYDPGLANNIKIGSFKLKHHSTFFWKGLLENKFFSNNFFYNNNSSYNYFFSVFYQIKESNYIKLSWDNYFLDNLGDANFFAKENPKFNKKTYAGLYDRNLSLLVKPFDYNFTEIGDMEFPYEPGFVFATLPFSFPGEVSFNDFFTIWQLNFYSWFSKWFFLKTLAPLKTSLKLMNKSPIVSFYDFSYNLSFQNFLRNQALLGLDDQFFNYKFFYKHFSSFLTSSSFFTLFYGFFFENSNYLFNFSDFSIFYRFFFLHLFFFSMDSLIFTNDELIFEEYPVAMFNYFNYFYSLIRNSKFFFENDNNFLLFFKILNFFSKDSSNVFFKVFSKDTYDFFDFSFFLKKFIIDFLCDTKVSFSELSLNMNLQRNAFLNIAEELKFLRWFFFFQGLDDFLFCFIYENSLFLDYLFNFYIFFDKSFFIDFFSFYDYLNIEDILLISYWFFEDVFFEDIFFEKNLKYFFDFSFINKKFKLSFSIYLVFLKDMDLFYFFIILKHFIFNFFKSFFSFFDFFSLRYLIFENLFYFFYFLVFFINFLIFLYYFYRFIFFFFRFLFVFLKYFYYIFYYIFISLYDRDIYEWEESFFFSRPDGEDFGSFYAEQGGFLEDVDPITSDDVVLTDLSLGHMFYFFSKPIPFFLFKHINYEFYYIFLEYFFATLFRLLFLFFYYFCFFIYRGFFFFFYVLIFFILFIFSFLLFVLFLGIYIFYIFFLNYLYILNAFLFIEPSLFMVFFLYKYSFKTITLKKCFELLNILVVWFFFANKWFWYRRYRRYCRKWNVSFQF
jgi:hypothetical protein